MNVMARPGVDKADFELWSLAVSAINGCGMCMESHEKVLLQHGVGKEAVQAAIRIAAVVHATAVTLEAEEALAGTTGGLAAAA
jgi:alkyl hydroperoxide reductase subunit D